MKKREITLKDIAELLIPKIWIILLVSVLCAGPAFAYSAVQDDTYTSNSLLYVYSDRNDSTEPSVGSVDVAKGMVEVYKVVLKSDKFLGGVVERLQGTEYEYLTADQIRSMMTISQVGDIEVLSLSITAYSKETAAYVLGEITNYSIERIPQLVPNALTVTPIDDPTVPTSPNSKNSVRNAGVVFVIAAIITSAAIWLISLLDVVIRDKKKIEDNLDIPVLGVIPKHEIHTQKGENKNV